MAQYTRWPLEGYEDAPPLSEERNADGKSLVNPAREGLSEAYREFPEPLRRDQRGGLYVSPCPCRCQC